MEESSKPKLTYKELLVEGEYLRSLSKEEKSNYKELSVEAKRNILAAYKAAPKQRIKFEKEINQSDENLARIYKRFEEIGAIDLFGTKKEVKELPMILKENETIMYVTSGIYDGNTYLIVCTDLRLLFLDKGLIYGLKFHEFPFDKINSVSYKKGLLFGTLLVHHGSSSITVSGIVKSTVSIMASTIQQEIEKSKEKSKSNNTNGNDSVITAADELLKYKELLDAGLLTQEEFNAKKEELL